MLTLACMGWAATAQERGDKPRDREREAIDAATFDALRNLQADIEREPITSRITVGDMLRRTAAAEALAHDLSRAELVGGPRWLDEDHCQVRLQISGVRVAHTLQQIAAAHEAESPVSLLTLASLARAWEHRSFAATGSATRLGPVASLRRGMSEGWAGITREARDKAVDEARQDAIQRVLGSIRSIQLAKDRNVADALAVTEVRQKVCDWLEARPVMDVVFRRDLHAEVTLAGTPDGLAEVVRSAVADNAALGVPTDERHWALVRADFVKQMAPPVGMGTVPPAALYQGEAPRPSLPLGIPTWVDRALESECTVDVRDTKLKANRAAEERARQELASQVAALPLARGLTVGAYVKGDAQLRDAIVRAVAKGKVTKRDFSAVSSVTVRVRLDLQDVWDELRAQR